MQRNQYGLLLSGGGARAAYQVGVLKSIANYLPRNHSIPFPIICGNSAGAINSTALATYASCYHLGVRKLEHIWKNFNANQVYDGGIRGTFGYILRNLMSGMQAPHYSSRATSLLNNQPLRRLIRKRVDFHRIDRNIMTGHLRAISVVASSYTSHESISYFQAQSDIDEWQREQRRGVRCVLTTEHLMASSAIPMVFPPVRMDAEYLGDGSVHQLSPLSTPIHLGADKILVIGVEQPERVSKFSNLAQFPSSANIAGHLLDTIFADTLHADIERMQRVNETLAILDDKQKAQTNLKPVECLVLNPSINFIDKANHYYHHLPQGIRTLLGMIGINDSGDSSLLSYLLFEQAFCSELIELGYHDGMDRQTEIRAFLNI